MRGRNPFTGKEESRLSREPDPGVASSYSPDAPPFPFVELPFDFVCGTSDLVDFYARVIGRAAKEFFFEDDEEVHHVWERIAPTSFSIGGDNDLWIHTLAEEFRDRVAAMTLPSWEEMLATLLPGGA